MPAIVLTLDRERRIIRDGAILVEGGRISRVGKAAELADARADRVIDGRRLVVTPGFFNGHMHISYAHPVRGIFPDEQASPLSHVFNLQSAMTEDEEYHATLLGLVELLKSGTVCFLDPGSTKFPDACLQAYEDAGIRVILGECVTDQEAPWTLPRYPPAEAVARTDVVHRQVERAARRADPRLGHAVLVRDVQRGAAPGAQAGGGRAAAPGSPSTTTAGRRRARTRWPATGTRPTDYLESHRRDRAERAARPLPRASTRREIDCIARTRHRGGDVPDHRGQGRPRRPRARPHAGAPRARA